MSRSFIFELTTFQIFKIDAMKLSGLKKELSRLIEIIREMDRKVIIIFLSVAILQRISWYYSSRNFFRINFFPYYQNHPDVYLYEYLYWFIGDFFTFFILSIIIIKFILKEDLKNHGLQFGDYKTGLALSVISFLVMLPVIWFFSAAPDFVAKYPHLLSTRNSWGEFFIYE